MVPPRKATSRVPVAVRNPLQVLLEIADQAAHREPRVLVDQAGRGALGDLLGDVDRDVGLEAAGLAHRVEQVARLRRRAGAELDQRAGIAGRDEDLARALAEDLPLGPSRVVLGQLGDLLEQLRAALVVEVFRRQLLRVGAEAGAHVACHRRRGVGVEVDVDRDHRSLAQRRAGEDLPALRQVPVAEARAGDVRVGRPGGAAQHLVARRRRRPRSTRDRERPRSRGRRGSRRRSTPRPSRPRPARDRAASHSCSVGRRLPAQLAKASACSQETWTTGSPASSGSRRPIAVLTHPPPSRSQYSGGSAPVASTNSA